MQSPLIILNKGQDGHNWKPPATIKGLQTLLSYLQKEIPTLHARVKKCLDALTLGKGNSKELDCLWYVLVMLACGNQKILHLNWTNFVIHDTDVFGVHMLPDIGKDIRDVLSESGEPHRSFIRNMIEYSMPFIKHNRVVFPAVHEMSRCILRDLIRVMLASCLGIYPKSQRIPLWTVRLQIFHDIYQLLHEDNHTKLYSFCEIHQSLMRISFLEFFVFFSRVNTPAEFKLMQQKYRDEQSLNVVFDNIEFVMDSFRQSVLHSTCSWKEIADAAYVAMERCSRVHKGRSARIIPKHCKHLTRQHYSDEDLHNALSTRRFSSTYYAMRAKIAPELSYEKLQRISEIHASVQIFDLPRSLALQQKTGIESFVNNQGICSLFPFTLYICLRCRNTRHHTRMRLSSDGVICCDHCRQTKYILSVNAIGRLIRIDNNKYYLCPFCLNVHLWKGTGCEFLCCSQSQKLVPSKPQTQCKICHRTFRDIETFSVLDDHLGVKTNVPLCRFHYPAEHTHNTIHNIAALRRAIAWKVHTKRGGTARNLPIDFPTD